MDQTSSRHSRSMMAWMLASRGAIAEGADPVFAGTSSPRMVMVPEGSWRPRSWVR